MSKTGYWSFSKALKIIQYKLHFVWPNKIKFPSFCRGTNNLLNLTNAPFEDITYDAKWVFCKTKDFM